MNPVAIYNSNILAIEDDPVLGAANKVLKMVKAPSGQPWAGATIYTMGTPGATPEVLTIDTVGLATSKLSGS